jgi:hypothetical protein
MHQSTRCASRPATGSSDHACLLFPSFSCSDKEKKEQSGWAELASRRLRSRTVSVPFLPKSGATVADVQKSITRLQHLFIPLLNAYLPFAQGAGRLLKDPAGRIDVARSPDR